MIGLGHIFAVAGILTLIGAVGLLLRKNLVLMLMSLELMLLGALLSLVGAARLHSAVGQGIAEGALLVPFVLVIAGAEVCVTLTLIMMIFKKQKTFWVDEIDHLQT